MKKKKPLKKTDIEECTAEACLKIRPDWQRRYFFSAIKEMIKFIESEGK